MIRGLWRFGLIGRVHADGVGQVLRLRFKLGVDFNIRRLHSPESFRGKISQISSKVDSRQPAKHVVSQSPFHVPSNMAELRNLISG